MSDSPSSGAKHETPDLAGQMAGEYRLQRKLGEGGFGAVYEAEHPVLRRRAAVKVLHQAARMDSDAVLRFISEAQAANQIRSRHIVDIFSFGTLADGRHFYVMDLLDGEPLDRHLDREKRLEVPAVLQLLAPIVEALDAAHKAGIVHRDLKPQNIFLVWEPGGETVPKLLDFGTAKLLAASPVQTVTGTPVGTPLYMSPEQARGDKVDGRADVYALGVLCHEMLAGQLPITGSSLLAVLMAQVSVAPPGVSTVRDDLPGELDQPILRMLEKDPNGRPASAGQALADLKSAAERAGYVIPAGMPKLRPPPAPPPKIVRGDTPTQRADSPPAGPVASSHATPVVGPPRMGARMVLALVGVIVAAGVAATQLLNRPAAPPGVAAAPVIEPAKAAAGTVEQDQAAAPSLPTPESVDLIIDGAPAGARILLDGKLLGVAPGPMPLRFGEVAVELTITAPGHEPKKLLVLPNRNLTVTVALARRPAGAGKPRSTIPKDLESPF